ncbi:MAG: ABC transporter ATP-binding protein [Actinomycetota bacterium]
MTGAGGGNEALLVIRDLRVSFRTPDGTVEAVRGIDLDLAPGEVLGIVGESGSGKSVAMLAVLGLLPRNATVSGSARFRDRELVGMSGRELRAVRGAGIGMVFQDPLTALNPVHRVGRQIAEAIRAHRRDLPKARAEARSVELLDAVGIPDPARRARAFPHELSGGMRQRVMIAMMIANEPAVLVADEPTTALDVTVQAQILDLLDEIRIRSGTAIVFITHDLGVIARIADRVQVLYAGRTAEVAPTGALFAGPEHPYTAGLLGAVPGVGRLRPDGIPGSPPSMLTPPNGCGFHPRCSRADARCASDQPPLVASGPGRARACFLPLGPDGPS